MYSGDGTSKWPVKTEKTCTRCGEVKNINEFHKKGKRKSNPAISLYNHICKDCCKVISKENYLNNKNSSLRLLYGITLNDYNKMFEEQKGCCAICGIHQSEIERAFSVDHDHNTGEIRSLLCINCNSGLGLFKDDLSILEEAKKYLEYFKN